MALQIVLDIEENLSSIRNEIMADLKIYFIKLGINTIERITNMYCDTKSQSHLYKYVIETYNNLTEDIKQRHSYNIRILESLCILDHLVPCEGIVFKYKNKTMKLTGIFGSLNQVIGSVKYKNQSKTK
jgi:hypothetical protein